MTARDLIRDLSVLADVVDAGAEVDLMLVTLLPGEAATFRITTSQGGAPERFLEANVLRSANDLLGHSGSGGG